MNLKNAITTTGIFDLTKVDQLQINLDLRKFKNEGGGIVYSKLFDIPVKDRMYEMSKRNLGMTIDLVAVAITLAFEKMNLSRKPTNEQIVDIAEAVVESSYEKDRISLEDLMLFLQKLTKGEYPELYEGIDQVKFFNRFEKYRDERWDAAIQLRNEKDEEFKRLGDDNFHERANQVSPLQEELSKFTSRMQEHKDEIKALKAERKRNFERDQFLRGE